VRRNSNKHLPRLYIPFVSVYLLLVALIIHGCVFDGTDAGIFLERECRS
jgi:hypothetical protein